MTKLGWSQAWLVLLCVGCASKSNSSGVTGTSDFAQYWADCTASCHHSAVCGLQDEAQCNTLCGPPRDTIASAVTSAGLASDDLRRCEEAQKLSDTCYLGLSCTDVTASPSPCNTQQMAASTNCSLIVSAIDLYLKQHAVTSFAGSFNGTYAGSESGSLNGVVTPWGAAVATIDSPSLGMVQGIGTVTGSTFAISGHGAATNASITATFSGMLQASDAVDAGVGASPGAFIVTGTWQSSAGGNGTFTLQSN